MHSYKIIFRVNKSVFNNIVVFFYFLFFFVSLHRAFAEKQTKHFVQIGDDCIEYNENFKLIFISNQSNPRFNAKIYSNTVIINFTITMESLENRLLNILFITINPSLATEYASLKSSCVAIEQRIVEVEDALLTQFELSDGQFLDNPDTMNLLESERHEVQEITSKSMAQKNTLTNIDMKRNEFRLIAQKAASLFFILAEMVSINSFYQHTLSNFINIFTQTIVTMRNSDLSLDQHLLKIIADLSKRLYNITSIGIFEKDKLLFSFRIAIELEYCDERLSRKEIDFLLKPTPKTVAVTTATTITHMNTIDNSLFDWLPNKQYNDIHLLATTFPDTFKDLLMHIAANTEKWKIWYYSVKAEAINCPEPYDTNTSIFQVT